MTGMTNEVYTIFGYRLSYFSMKLEAALQLMGVPFQYQPRTMEVRDRLMARAGTQQIPVLQTPEGWVLADTSPLIDLLDGRYPMRRLYPEGPSGALVHVVEEFFDEWMTRAAVHFRWNFEENAVWASQQMGVETAPDQSAETQQSIGQMIAMWGKKSCRAMAVDQKPQQEEIEAESLAVLEALEAQLGETRYALGDGPCAVDAVLIGMLRAHFLADPEPTRRFSHLSKVVAYAKAEHPLTDSRALAPFPQSTPFARFVLERMKVGYGPLASANAAALKAQEKGAKVQLSSGEVSFKAREDIERARRMVVARIQNRLSADERAEVVSWLERCSLADVFS